MAMISTVPQQLSGLLPYSRSTTPMMNMAQSIMATPPLLRVRA
jgi:hypothetical protein